MLDALNEKCGVFGAFGKGLEAARLTYFGLWALQHRGQESSGITATDGTKLYTHKDQGLVAHVYDEVVLGKLPGYGAIGHNRYSTSKGSSNKHIQPVNVKSNEMALAHNGNLPSTTALEHFLMEKKIEIKDKNDSEMMAAAINYYIEQGLEVEEAVIKSYPLFTGAFSLLVMTPEKLIGLRDSYGIRPLSLGKLNGGYILSSETCALDVVNATYLRDIRPGEMVVIDDKGIRSKTVEQGVQRLDIFEFVYFARPDSILLGKRVNEVRRNMGIQLAKEYPIEADMVIPVPDSAIPAAEGYAEQSGLAFRNGLIKNRYIHRTFIRPEQHQRELDIEIKLNPIPEVLQGQRVVVIDDSIVRGTTTKKLIEMIYKSGAKEVHMLSSSPPVRYPDFYGIDTPSQEKLIAAQKSVEQIREYIMADSLHFLSLEGMIKATELPKSMFSLSCFNGEYPIDLGERRKEVKQYTPPPYKRVKQVENAVHLPV